MPEEITSSVAAKIIGITHRATRLLCQNGKLRCRKLGRDWLVEKRDALRYRDSERKTGPKPKKKGKK